MYMTVMYIPKANPSMHLLTNYSITGLNSCLCKMKCKKRCPKCHGSPEGVESMQSGSRTDLVKVTSEIGLGDGAV